MENASNALLMAAGILIGVLVLSLAVYLFADFGATSAEINKQSEQQKIIQFNSQFTSYEDKELTIYDVVTILGYAQENNKYYEGSTNEQITVILKTQNITNYTEEQKEGLIQGEQINITGSNTKLPTYRLPAYNIKYDSDTGKVNFIKFV